MAVICLLAPFDFAYFYSIFENGARMSFEVTVNHNVYPRIRLIHFVIKMSWPAP